MATHISQKLSTHLPTLRKAVDGSSDLRSNQKLYKKVYKYYKDLGVNFTGDSALDYDTVLDCLYEDIY